MGGRGDRSQPTGPKDKGGIGRQEDTKVGGAACKSGYGNGQYRVNADVDEDGGERWSSRVKREGGQTSDGKWQGKRRKPTVGAADDMSEVMESFVQLCSMFQALI